jgi:hypothetical protein
MEPKMISLKVLSTVAAVALVASMALPGASIAQGPPGLKETTRPGGGGGGAPAPRFSGGGGGFRAGGGGGSPPVAQFNGGGGGYRSGGGVYRGGGYGGGGGYYRDGGGGGGGFIPGAVAGAVIGGAIASQGYYGGPGYYAPGPGYYDDSYADEAAVVVAPAPVGDDSVAYCMQTYRSYDPASGTYLGNDGFRHPCP